MGVESSVHDLLATSTKEHRYSWIISIMTNAIYIGQHNLVSGLRPAFFLLFLGW